MSAAAKTSNRKDLILREATHLFAANGFNGTPVRLIARHCGVTEAAIYRHYASKEFLYEEVIRAKAAEHDIAGRMARNAAGDDVERMLTRVAEYVMSFAETDPELLQLMANSTRGNDPAATVLFHEIRLPLITFVETELQRRMDADEIRSINPFITARCFVGMVMDCAMSAGVWQQLNETPVEARDAICNNMPIFARGLETRPAEWSGSNPGDEHE